MMCVGKVLEVWRYPVSSIGGELMESIETSSNGVVGDREFALFDLETGLPAAPEKAPRWRPALFMACDRIGGGLPRLGFPDGRWMQLDDTRLRVTLEQYFGFQVGVGVYAQSALGDENRFPVVRKRYAPSPLHVLTTASLEKLSQLSSVSDIDRRRFRPSILIESEEQNVFLENSWIGQKLQIGELPCNVVEGTKRCGMTLIAQPGLEEEPEILRNILRHNSRNLGVYCDVKRAGTVSVGDPVYADI
ncbi:MOSC domain-containing protein [Pararhizobium antarcticum]|uniref:MOSC domain-containing protein n=1 Tax=Pararhizobium antarcticum TaxID=1798805 RepID=A0A657LV90_9HYPH|nr:MOSC domain-containing protein [Pararhizobium antarcticum]OJF98191.1 hypothetical protein AX761_12610 [Rhizobium sp. 58]OJF99183.1 hypothetical protein AX760_13245 [Pararhizobium antarcticum]